MKTVIVTSELAGVGPHGGIGTFVWHFSRLLRSVGEEVTVLLPGETRLSSRGRLSRYEDLGVCVNTVAPRDFTQGAVGGWDFVRRGHAVADAIPGDADVVYVQDWLADGFVPVRMSRFSAGRRPVFVNVLHSPTAWIREAMCEYPRHVLHDMSRDFAERYVAEHADFVVSPSRYMLDWVRDQGWALPPGDRTVAIGYPFISDPQSASSALDSGTPPFRRIAFLGRYEVRKGAELFVRAIGLIHRHSPHSLAEVEEIAFIGPEGNVGRLSPRKARRLLSVTGKAVRHHRRLDTSQVQSLLARWAADTLVVIPSLDDNYPYVAIEASLIPGINLLCARTGGIPEILPLAGDETLFEPTERLLADAIANRLADGPRPSEAVSQYDWKAHNRLWLDFHARAAASERSRTIEVRTADSSAQSVDVCIPCFNHGRYLPQLLDALSRQTTPPGTVTVIDDNSTDQESRNHFNEMRQRYERVGWHFQTLEKNRGVSAVRNAAAAAGRGQYLLFLDSDNVPLPRMIERYVTAIEAAGDDCLTCYFAAFGGDVAPFPSGATDRAGVRSTDPTPFIATKYSFLPLGACVTLGLFDNFFGDASFIVRRSVFEQLGGFCQDAKYRHATHEDYDFLLRMALGGYTLDVVPEVLFYYRLTDNGLMKTTDEYRNRLRIQRIYADQFRAAGVPGLAPYLAGMYERGKPMEFLVAEMRRMFQNPVGTIRALTGAAARRFQERAKRGRGA